MVQSMLASICWPLFLPWLAKPFVCLRYGSCCSSLHLNKYYFFDFVVSTNQY